MKASTPLLLLQKRSPKVSFLALTPGRMEQVLASNGSFTIPAVFSAHPGNPVNRQVFYLDFFMDVAHLARRLFVG